MALALSTGASSSRAIQYLLPSQNRRRFPFTNLVLPPHPLSRSSLALSRRRNNVPAITSSSSSKKKKRRLPPKENDDDEEEEEDPFEALFSRLEEDLKNDDSMVDDDDEEEEEIDEEDMEKLASELAEALGDVDMEMFDTATDGTESVNDDSQQEEEEEEEVKLKNWQLRKLAYALKTGRRKVSVKSLAAELCLDRAIVLQMLRDPPPNLLLLSATLPDEPTPTVLVNEVKRTETIIAETTVQAVEPKTKVEESVHDRQHRWSAQKRLKKVQVKTLEMVYRRSKRPTNAMISSIVQVTNLPRQRIVKWFEDRRAEEGVPERRKPYQRYDPQTVFSS